MSIRWSPEHEQFIKDNHGKLSFGEIAARLGRTRSQISGKVDRLGLSSGTPRHLRATGLPRRRSVLSSRRTEPDKPYEEPMPQLVGDQVLHSRSWNDVEPGMCSWPLYVEQGVQMYCAAATERLPGRFDTYCKCHRAMSQQPRKERQQKYKRGIWVR